MNPNPKPHMLRTVVLVALLTAATIVGIWELGEATMPRPGVPQQVVTPDWYGQTLAPPERPPHPREIYTPSGRRS